MRKRLLTLLLCGALLLPGTVSSAAEGVNPVAQTAQAELVDADGLITDKTAAMQPDGSVRLRLETYVTGASYITGTVTDVPTDIVLVLDQSGSMAFNMSATYQSVYKLSTRQYYYVAAADGEYFTVWYTDGAWRTQNGSVYQPKTSAEDADEAHVQFYTQTVPSRMEALKSAAQAFAASVAKRATAKSNHRIAVVGFAGDAKKNYTNTELFIGGTSYRYKEQAEAHYASALQDMSTQQGTQNVAASIRALDAKGATHTELGVDMARGIFSAAGAAAGRNRVVVVFTDGEPGNSGFATDTANSALSAAESLKSGGVTVFSVGIFPGANPEDTNLQANRFMNYLSSNYPEAKAMDRPGQPGEKDGYYLAASSAEELQNVFRTISDRIETGGASLALGASTQIRDAVSDYFVLPQSAQERNITLRTAAFTGYDSDGETPLWGPETDTELTAQVQGGTVQVTGFDFSAQYVGMDRKDGVQSPHGSKLILELTVLPRPGFLGGNQVPTNGESSGVYEADGTLVENYPRPRVDVPIPRVSVVPQDRNVYLLGALTEPRQLEGAQVTCGGVDLTGDTEPWQTAFVTVDLRAGGEKTGLTEDGDYQLQCTVAPRYDGAVQAAVGTGLGHIAVFVPCVTLADRVAWYGDHAPLDCTAESVAWRHGTVDSGEVAMEGQAPTLTLSAAPMNPTHIQEGRVAVKTDIPMAAAAFVGDRDVTDWTELCHRDCADACGWTDASDYLLHVKTCALTVEKTGGREGETYVFQILRNGQTYTQARITGNGSVTVGELPVGLYTLRENSDWSWRWGAADYTEPVRLTSDARQGTLTCRNQNRESQWLNGYSPAAVNLYRGGDRR